MDLGPVALKLQDKLITAFSPTSLSVIDESYQHHGHAGAHADGESHFRVIIVAHAFRGQSRVAQHRMINSVLAEDLATRVHALAIQSSAPV